MSDAARGEIGTPRLVLRPQVPDDADAAFAAYAGDAEATRFVTWRPHASALTVREHIEARTSGAGSVARLAWHAWRREDGALAGAIGLRVEAPRAHVGYVVAPALWGRGYATEMARAVVAAALARPDVHRVEAMCEVGHAASSNVMRKCGMAFEGVLRRFIVLPNLSDVPRDVEVWAVVKEDAVR